MSGEGKEHLRADTHLSECLKRIFKELFERAATNRALFEPVREGPFAPRARSRRWRMVYFTAGGQGSRLALLQWPSAVFPSPLRIDPRLRDRHSGAKPSTGSADPAW